MDRGQAFLSRIRNEIFMLDKSTLASLLTLGSVDVDNTAKDEIIYEEIGNVSVISIDGAMAKKTQHGLCMSVYGYDTIAQYLTQAESNPKIDTVIFRVDSPGGHVAGVDDLEDRIFKSPLKTITLYENTGASAAVYAFSASDEIFATKSTEVGSIGALATVPMSKDEPTHMAIVSQNAENKVCDMENGCYERLQSKLNTYEDMFLSTVSKNTGMDKDSIINGFNNGETIFAEDALSIGFLDGIKTFHDLLNEVVTGTIPTAASDKIAKQKKGTAMAQEELTAQVQTLTEENQNLLAQVNGFDEVKETAVKAAVDKAMATAKEQFTATMVARVKEAAQYEASYDTIVAMVSAFTSEDASKILLNSEESRHIGGDDGGHTGKTEMKQYSEKLLAFAQRHKGSIR